MTPVDRLLPSWETRDVFPSAKTTRSGSICRIYCQCQSVKIRLAQKLWSLSLRCLLGQQRHTNLYRLITAIRETTFCHRRDRSCELFSKLWLLGTSASPRNGSRLKPWSLVRQQRAYRLIQRFAPLPRTLPPLPPIPGLLLGFMQPNCEISLELAIVFAWLIPRQNTRVSRTLSQVHATTGRKEPY